MRLSSDLDGKRLDTREPQGNSLFTESGPVLVRVPETGSQELTAPRSADIGNLERGGSPFLVRVIRASDVRGLFLRRSLIGAAAMAGTLATIAFVVHVLDGRQGVAQLSARNGKTTQNSDSRVNKIGELSFPLRTENPGLQPLNAEPRSNTMAKPVGQTAGEPSPLGMAGASGISGADSTPAGVSVPALPIPEAPPQTLVNFQPQEERASMHARQLSLALVNGTKARETELLDEAAWQSVSLNDQSALDSYLKNFPSGKHAPQAQQLLSKIAAAHMRDVQAVLAALDKYSKAWSTKDIADITALRPGLAPRAVKQELSSVRSIAMHIRPVSSPKIEGDRAAVDCIHEVAETFSDGVEKSKPGVRMTYALVRNGDGWLIQDSR